MEDYFIWAVEKLDIKITVPLYSIVSAYSGRGLYCSTEILPHSGLMHIPFDALLTVKSIERSELNPILHQCREDDILVLALCSLGLLMML